MSPQQPLPENEVEVTTIDREHLSAVIYRTLGFVSSKVFTDTMNRNPHLVELPPLFPANTKIRIFTEVEAETPTRQVLTLWSSR